MKDSISALILREAREQGDLTQRSLAERAGTHQAVVGRIEAGASSPSLDTLERLVAAAGFDLEIELVPRPAQDPVIEVYKQDIDQTLLVENLRMSVTERLRANMSVDAFAYELRKGMVRKVAEEKP